MTYSTYDVEFQLRWLTVNEAVRRSGRIVNIYREAFGHNEDATKEFAKVFREGMTSFPGASCLVAEIDGEIVGFLYGFDFIPTNPWAQSVGPALEAAGHGEYMVDCFELAEEEVDPAFHGRGIGSALLHAQLDSMRRDRSLLATHPDNPARRLYRRVGFVELLPDFTYPGTDEPAVIMGWERS